MTMTQTQTQTQTNGKAIKRETSEERIIPCPSRTSSPSQANGDMSAASAVPQEQKGSPADTHNLGNGEPSSTKTTLFVGGIARWVRPSDLERKFREFGHVIRVDVPLQFGSTNMSRGYAFVHFRGVQDAEAAIEALNGSTSELGANILVEKSIQGRRSFTHGSSPSALGHRGYAFPPLTAMNGGDPWGRSHTYNGRYEDRNYDRDAGRPPNSRVCLPPSETEPVFDRYARPLVYTSQDWVTTPEVFDRYGRPLEFLPRYETPRRRVVEEYVEEPIPRFSRGVSPGVVPRLIRREDSPSSRRCTRSPSFSSRRDHRDGQWERTSHILRS